MNRLILGLSIGLFCAFVGMVYYELSINNGSSVSTGTDHEGPPLGTEMIPPVSAGGLHPTSGSSNKAVASVAEVEAPIDTTAKQRWVRLDPDYCTAKLGLSVDACSRVAVIAKAGRRPSYCKAGYEMADSGLATEQRLACDMFPYPHRSDPYAAGQRTLQENEYEQRKAQGEARIAEANWAHKCDVISEMDTSLIGLMEGQLILGPGQVNTSDPNLESDMSRAAIRGADQAKIQGCDSWRNNPEAVRAIRLQAQLAAAAH